MTIGNAPPVQIAVDIGGTFTDLQIFDVRSGAMSSFKTPTTPQDPSLGLLTGIKDAGARDGFAPTDISYLLHGTTIATNAVLERKLAKGALLTTARFEDVLEIGRHYRRDVYSLNPQPPGALIPRQRRIGIAERIRANGSIEVPLLPAALASAAEKLDRLEVTSVAVCLLNSYLNPEHEHRIAEYLATTRPALSVSCSSDLNAEIREYERTSTTVLNALLIPVLAGYMEQLGARLAAVGCKPRLLFVQSNGGVCGATTAAKQPVRLLLSGPSGGSAACALLGRALGEANIVGVDMGGTSFDVSVVRDGEVSLITEGEIDRMPVRLPMVEIRTIGAGGGSLAKVHASGRLTVGPQSAGSRPGPACYGLGGTEPTVTDANVVLGRLDGDNFLGGAMRLDVAAARTAIAARVGSPLGVETEAGAEGLLAVTNANLGAAIRLSLFEKGLDPRDFAMIAFGGAAGLHAIAVADELGIKRVIFPQNAGTLSAYGILHSDLKHDLTRSHVLHANKGNLAALATAASGLLAAAQAQLAADAIASGDRHIELAADMRYQGQAFELTVPAQAVVIDGAVLEALIAGFHDAHRRRFSYANPEAAVEIVSLRVSAIGRLPKPPIMATSPCGGATSPRRRNVWMAGGWHEVDVFCRDQIGADALLEGPAVIEEAYTTVFLASGWTCRRDKGVHLVAGRRD